MIFAGSQGSQQAEKDLIEEAQEYQANSAGNLSSQQAETSLKKHRNIRWLLPEAWVVTFRLMTFCFHHVLLESRWQRPQRETPHKVLRITFIAET